MIPPPVPPVGIAALIEDWRDGLNRITRADVGPDVKVEMLADLWAEADGIARESRNDQLRREVQIIASRLTEARYDADTAVDDEGLDRIARQTRRADVEARAVLAETTRPTAAPDSYLDRGEQTKIAAPPPSMVISQVVAAYCAPSKRAYLRRFSADRVAAGLLGRINEALDTRNAEIKDPNSALVGRKATPREELPVFAVAALVATMHDVVLIQPETSATVDTEKSALGIYDADRASRSHGI
ncbi:MAG: hypothetical protein QM809_18375 [Gordonia sp. (in: high G+C Gram-positive bacteria)]|uniref:hypothetical protein n=1 Tax=Gordonia sp. (in: high G+C Gram-positive bacteria) TaxID=84139 RepID=UPI0039E27C2E